jgi:RNA polymerase sigma-70 factor (ECF subfamily)
LNLISANEVLLNDQNDTRNWFSHCIEENLNALYAVAVRLTRNDADAQDLVAEAVTRAWFSIETLLERERIRPWLFRILRNQFISDCRKRKVRPRECEYLELSVSSDDESAHDEFTAWLCEQPDAFLNWWSSPEQDFANRLLKEQIMTAIERLPGVFRMVVLLINVDGLTYDEAAAVLGIPTGTVRSRMKRGRTLLQKALWRQAADAGLTKGESSPRCDL